MLMQFRATNAFIETLSEQQWWLPTRLGSWRVIELAAHLTASLDLVLRATVSQPCGVATSSPLQWYRNVDQFADAIDKQTRAAAATGWAEVRNAMARRLVDLIDVLAGEDPRRVVTAGNERMTLEALCATRCVEVVLHTLDLVAATSMPCRLDADAADIVRRFVEVADNGARLVRPEL